MSDASLPPVSFPAHLVDRYRRFRFGSFAANFDHYARLAAHGQSPDTMVVSCCDSRVDPEVVFAAVPGELFVVRNVANLVPPFETGGRFHGVSAALEFAVLNLRVSNIIVIGHSGCGGVRACLDHDSAEQTEALFIRNWMSMLDDARDALVATRTGASADELAADLEREGVKVSLANLRTFPCIEILEGRGKLALHGAHFDIGTGTLTALNPTTNTFTPL